MFLIVLNIQERHLNDDPADAAVEHVDLARLYRDMKKDAEAEDHFQQAAQLLEKSARLKAASGDVAEDDSRNQEILVLRELAEFYSNLDRFADAEKAYDQIIDIQEDYDLSRGHEVADSYSDLGQIYQAQNKPEKATIAFRLANLLPQASLKYRRDGSRAVCFDMIKLAPLYFKLDRYLQVKQVYDIASGKPCMAEKASEVASLLDQVLGKLAARPGAGQRLTPEDVDGIRNLRATVAELEKNKPTAPPQ
jgi:tetratricopeptide (TPR) repeat protein